MKRSAGSPAFTLIELLVVIAIIGLLASIVMANLSSARQKAALAAARQLSSTVDNSAGAQALGWWDFSECSGSVAIDRSGYGNNGTLVGSPAWSSDTPLGQGCSLSFTGANYVAIPNGVAVTTSFTLAAWFKTSNGQSTNWRTIFSKQIAAPQSRNYWFGLSGSYLAQYCGYGSVDLLYTISGVSDAGHVCSPLRYDDNTWHFAAATYDGTTLRMYVDGALVGSNAAAAPDQQTVATNIGIYNDNASIPFLGLLDSLRILQAPLTASEIHALYAAEAPRYRVAER